jgi:hypothetical protein
MRAFIIDMVRRNGRRFITSVSEAGQIKPTVARHHGQSVTVSHWENTHSDQPQLIVRFPL